MNLEPIKARREALTALNIKDFYAHAPTDIAELVAEVERLRAVIDMLDKLMDPDYYRFASAGDVLSDLRAVLKMKVGE